MTYTAFPYRALVLGMTLTICSPNLARSQTLGECTAMANPNDYCRGMVAGAELTSSPDVQPQLNEIMDVLAEMKNLVANCGANPYRPLRGISLYNKGGSHLLPAPLRGLQNMPQPGQQLDLGNPNSNFRK